MGFFTVRVRWRAADDHDEARRVADLLGGSATSGLHIVQTPDAFAGELLGWIGDVEAIDHMSAGAQGLAAIAAAYTESGAPAPTSTCIAVETLPDD